MRKSIFSAAAEKRFRKKARNYLTKTYGDIFSWQAALEIGEQTTHLFSAAANDMSVVCQVHYLRLKKRNRFSMPSIASQRGDVNARQK